MNRLNKTMCAILENRPTAFDLLTAKSVAENYQGKWIDRVNADELFWASFCEVNALYAYYSDMEKKELMAVMSYAIDKQMMEVA